MCQCGVTLKRWFCIFVVISVALIIAGLIFIIYGGMNYEYTTTTTRYKGSVSINKLDYLKAGFHFHRTDRFGPSWISKFKLHMHAWIKIPFRSGLIQWSENPPLREEIFVEFNSAVWDNFESFAESFFVKTRNFSICFGDILICNYYCNYWFSQNLVISYE